MNFIRNVSFVHVTVITMGLIATSHISSFTQALPSSFIKNLIEHSDATCSDIVVDHEIIHHNDLLISFYKATKFQLAWYNRQNIEGLLAAIRDAEKEGLDPEDYHLQSLDRRYFNHYYLTSSTNELHNAYFDLLLTDAYFRYGSHLLVGKTDPELLYPGEWETTPREADLVMILSQGMKQQEIGQSLESLKPDIPGYKKLKGTLLFYKKIKQKGGWSAIPEGPPLEPCVNDSRVPIIRKRLSITNHVSPLNSHDSTAYDSTLVAGVKKFQQENGLKNDGVIGRNTLTALNYSVDDYIEKIKVNLERYRWLPRPLGEQYVYVNTPSFWLEVHRGDSIVLAMKAILGRPERKTPVFSSTIRYLILNPTWTIPHTILEEDVLPAVKQNIEYLSKHRLRVIDRLGGEISPDSLPWSTYTIDNFPYLLRQDPGQFNALGLIKFQFPNHHSVFLHDTNLHSLFNESYRALSSGCIRIEKPFELATYLLKGSGWTSTRLMEIIENGETKTIVFSQPVRIHLVYFTAFVNTEGDLQLRNDLYGWDQKVLHELVNTLSP